jgi:uncharacterized protein YbjT (DUF2867 family)
MKTLVIGGKGNVGSAVVSELLKRKAHLRLLVRKPEGSATDGIEVVQGDLLDPPSVRRALEGVDKLYLLNAVTPDELTQALIAIDLAHRAGLKQMVYHSVYKADHFKDVPHFASKAAVEEMLKTFRLPYTILRPNYFMQNETTLKDVLTKAGLYPMPLGDTGVSAVDVRDIAEAAATVLTEDGHLGQSYDLNGPEPVTGPGAAKIWSEVLKREVRYTGHGMDAFEQQMAQRMPTWSAFDLRMMFQGYLERGFIATPTELAAFEKLLGHAPRSYRNFAAETAAHWASSL